MSGSNRKTGAFQHVEDELLTRRVTLFAQTTPVPPDLAITIPGTGGQTSYPADAEFRVINIDGLSGVAGPSIAVSADPWGGAIAIQMGATVQSLRQIATVTRPALMGELLTDLPAGEADIWDEQTEIDVWIPDADLNSANADAVLDGLNRMLFESAGVWTLVAWTHATLIGPDTWRLSGLRRGLLETPIGAVSAGATAIVADDRLVALPLTAEQTNVDLLMKIGTETPISFKYEP